MAVCRQWRGVVGQDLVWAEVLRREFHRPPAVPPGSSARAALRSFVVGPTTTAGGHSPQGHSTRLPCTPRCCWHAPCPCPTPASAPTRAHTLPTHADGAAGAGPAPGPPGPLPLPPGRHPVMARAVRALEGAVASISHGSRLGAAGACGRPVGPRLPAGALGGGSVASRCRQQAAGNEVHCEQPHHAASSGCRATRCWWRLCRHGMAAARCRPAIPQRCSARSRACGCTSTSHLN